MEDPFDSGTDILDLSLYIGLENQRDKIQVTSSLNTAYNNTRYASRDFYLHFVLNSTPDSMVNLPIEISDAVRTHVFDRMPIRLLKMDSLNYFEVVDRVGTLHHIREKIGDIDDTMFKKMIEERRLVNPGASEFDLMRSITVELISKHAQYTILSHTWLQDGTEVTYQDFHDPARIEAIRSARGEGYTKLEKFCEVTQREYKMTLAWMDTICINKDSSSELDESIRSMYNWYLFSAICIVTLAGSLTIADMEHDRWFTRGWTLQELLAPKKIKFYNQDWVPLSDDENDKQVDWVFSPPKPARAIERAIEKVTGIDYSRLFYYPTQMSGKIAERMTWVAKRRTTRGEDIAYSLMGIFGVSISIAYGEGVQRAFFRLLEAILSSAVDIFDILNWGGRPIDPEFHVSRLVPSTPDCYLKYVDFRSETEKNALMYIPDAPYLPSKPMILTHLGMRTRLLLVPTQLVWPVKAERSRAAVQEAKMKCLGPIWEDEPVTFRAVFYDTDDYGAIPVPSFSTDLVAYFNPIVASDKVALTYFGLYMFNEGGRHVEVPRSLCAICLRATIPKNPDGSFSLDDLSSRYITANSVVGTAEPIVVKRNDKYCDKESKNQGLMIEKSYLAELGMKLQTLYL